MRGLRALVGLTALGGLHAATVPMDSARGDLLFRPQGCFRCHKFRGQGGSVAPNGGPDLGHVLDRACTHSLLAGTMRNHAPAMWTKIKTENVKVGDIDGQAAADLFALFCSARYFELPGDAGRGKELFTSKSCKSCHGLARTPNPNAKPVNQWQGLSDPIALVGAMWNDSPAMWTELSERKISGPNLTSQDLSDLLVYLRNVSPSRGGPPTFRIAAGENGETLFVECHTGAGPGPVLPVKDGTYNGMNMVWALWRHGPTRLEQMNQRHMAWPVFKAGEMSDLIARLNEGAKK